MDNVHSIRTKFLWAYKHNHIAENGTIEIINASFLADENFIFGKVNEEYCQKELDWYLSESLFVKDIGEPIPKIWKQICDRDGRINSNYGWCIGSEANGNQFDEAMQALYKDKASRQAVMIYIRPTMHADSIAGGMKDFMCTYSTQLLIRKNMLHYIVNMRSNDAIFGYKNDFFWHNYVFDYALKVLKNKYPELEKGDMYWNAGSLHVYPRHFYLIGE